MSQGRELARAKVSILISYRLSGDLDERYSMLADLSVGGAQFTTESDIAFETPIEVEIKLPWCGEPLRLAGTVKRCVRIQKSVLFRVAVSFSKIADQDRKEIAKIVQIRQREENLEKLL